MGRITQGGEEKSLILLCDDLEFSLETAKNNSVGIQGGLAWNISAFHFVYFNIEIDDIIYMRVYKGEILDWTGIFQD